MKGIAWGVGFGIALVSVRAHAVDLPKVADKPVQLEITETSVVAQRFRPRLSENERYVDHGWGAWINRLNLALRWNRFTLGTRLDSSMFWLRPEDREIPDSVSRDQVVIDGASRYRDTLYPAKIFLQYQAPGLEVTAGDAYVQFGRGLSLSMRKIDELGVDTTLRGGKIAWQHDPFALTLVAGIANPTRVDEATGRALFLPKNVPGDRVGAQPVYGSDRIVGALIQAGRGLPVTLTTHAVRLTRCAPYRYDAQGSVIGNEMDAPIGSCEPSDTTAWLANKSPLVRASEVMVAGQGFELPDLWGHGQLYVEAAIQRRRTESDTKNPVSEGNAVYASLSTNAGAFTNTVELKSYRNFYPLAGAIDPTRAVEFTNVQYSTPPTAELLTQDSMFGFFNACVDGGRMRSNVRLSPQFLVYGQGIFARTRSEVTGGGCDRWGVTQAVSPADEVRTTVWDGLGGFEWNFDDNRSQLFASLGARDDRKDTGDMFYQEKSTQYTMNKHIGGPFAIEFMGRHRIRKEEFQNVRNAEGIAEPWREGEHYTALKVAPKWVFSQGIEYTTRLGLPTYYFNGSILYRFTSESNIRIFGGQQRGGLKCVSGVCKVFPPYEGVRLELTLRF